MEINIIEDNSKYYPDSLREIPNSPKQLYYSGDISLLSANSIAVVGSRKYTVYGKNVAHMIGKALGASEVPVVSGLASGIDTFAHEGVLDGDGQPIAVLGTGINRIYPPRNKALMEEVAKKGLVISEYEPDFGGKPYTFPARNRIIAGLAKAVVLIEANFKSGALITAQYAMDYGKTVYAVPGNINSQFSMGTNLLLRDGATPLVVIDDLLREMNVEVKDVKVEKMNLSGDEMDIYNVIKQNNGISVDDISHILNKKTPELSAILTILEIKGAVTSYGGKFHLAK